MCTKYGVDSSSHFPFRVQTDKQSATHEVTHEITLPTHRLQLETVNMRRRFTQLDVM